VVPTHDAALTVVHLKTVLTGAGPPVQEDHRTGLTYTTGAFILFTVRLIVGPTGRPIIFTVTEAVTGEPDDVWVPVIVNVVFAVRLFTTCVPDVLFDPDHPSDATKLVSPKLFQSIVTLLPLGTVIVPAVLLALISRTKY
jgi:hypothetical protein